MPYAANRTKETTTTTGTGTLSLGGTSTRYQTFVAGVGSGATVHYTIQHRTLDEWEVGIGTVTDAATDTLSRTTILASSNSGSAVDFSAGTKDVLLAPVANRQGIGSGGIEVNTAVAASPNVIDHREAGTVFSNEGTAALNCYTLPSAVAGYGPFTFIVQDSDGIKVTAAAGDTIRNAASVSGAAGFITNTTTGSVVTLYCINATEWIVIAAIGTWTVT